ncbi:MarR family winged helix-turn-helix transcriptional regulator [Tanticharoenia sakaeratensis]|jgi:DNA-binding MarR family transcriptional regulator|uniref:Transcriptional regulator n=2 Tax=Tanticharoenia TaxID=444052 RepID=A0A0D6MP76_9PROT|nr:MarR family transcriptional regulator [Tanticharoenia sakaeratensis]GAN55093.1 transcriptional regulator [Tanticharoenia sakaeratensis NBRC 103193]GBQ20196.1 MarR family transcriptional regulator [Tanticharoenia sakaeratensis NBRC 103193]
MIPMPQDAPGSAHLYLREQQLRVAYEAMMQSWRDLQADCDPALRQARLGPAHHRILFLIASHDGITMTTLLDRLGITKQSLSRALGELVERDLVTRTALPGDRRRKPLSLTTRGAALERHLFDLQRARLTRAFRAAGVGAVDGFRKVLAGLAESAEPARIQS